LAVFDAYIKKVADKVDGLRGKGRQVREFNCPATSDELLDGLPIRVGPQANSGIVLRGDTFVELGSPDAGSCAFVLWTDNLSLIRDGKVTLIGPDIQESPTASLPFGQVLMVGGTELGNEDHSPLEQSQIISDQIEGYMIRSTSERMWSRVSKEVAGKGFCFDTLGRALMAIFKTGAPKIEAMEVLFMTSSKEDVEQLGELASQVREISKNIVTENWKAKGFDILECNFGWDCNSCDYKPVCDDIREVITIRKSKTESVGTTPES
jgi:CO dehydrogenase/acetyl-CoA synthase beta subunit